MSSKWANRVSQALGLRLAAWYLGTFLASTLVISGLTYGLLAQLLVASGASVLLYFGLCTLLRVEALDFFIAAVRRRMRRR